MASELKVNKLTGVTTAGSISVTGEGNSTTTNLQQGLCKVFSRASSTQDSILDSFNQSSSTDVGTGQFTVTFTNALSNSNIIMVTAGHSSADRNNTTRNISASSYDMQCFNQAGSTSDTQQSSAAFGDLA